MNAENWYSGETPTADARSDKRERSIAGTYRQSDLWDQIERMHEKDPDKVSATHKIGLGHYVAAREAAQRVAGDA